MADTSAPTPPTPLHARSWGTDNGAYSPTKSYVTSSNGPGDTGQLKVRIPSALLSEMAEIVQSGKMPDYRTAQDIVRDALYHRLHWLNEKLVSPAMERTLGLYRMQAEMDALTRRQQAEDEYVAKAKENLARASANPVELRALVEMLTGHVRGAKDLSAVAKRTLESEIANYARGGDA